jgi:hypothetical protein
MLHAYVERFDVMGGRENILGWDEEVNKAYRIQEETSTEKGGRVLKLVGKKDPSCYFRNKL